MTVIQRQQNGEHYSKFPIDNATPILQSTNVAVLGCLGIMRQCHEWADYIGGGEAKWTITDLKAVRPGMGYFTTLPHAMIITDVKWEKGYPVQFRVAEANWGTGWVNPNGFVPWERKVKVGREVAYSKAGTIRSYE
ncbi:MAG: hypothetical protein WC156_14285 [Pedobacter sp.]